jgi:hypothetical protein
LHELAPPYQVDVWNSFQVDVWNSTRWMSGTRWNPLCLTGGYLELVVFDLRSCNGLSAAHTGMDL